MCKVCVCECECVSVSFLHVTREDLHTTHDYTGTGIWVSSRTQNSSWYRRTLVQLLDTTCMRARCTHSHPHSRLYAPAPTRLFSELTDPLTRTRLFTRTRFQRRALRRRRSAAMHGRELRCLAIFQRVFQREGSAHRRHRSAHHRFREDRDRNHRDRRDRNHRDRRDRNHRDYLSLKGNWSNLAIVRSSAEHGSGKGCGSSPRNGGTLKLERVAVSSTSVLCTREGPGCTC